MSPADRERVQELLRQVFAIISKYEEPNIRSVASEVEHHENLAHLAAHPKPQPLPPIGPPISPKLEPAEEVE